MANAKIGIWLIGARGGVSTMVAVGLAALRRGVVGSQGLVSTLPQFADLNLVEWSDFVVGGHEIRSLSLVDEARRFARENRTPAESLVELCREELEATDSRIRPGILLGAGPTIESLADRTMASEDATPRAAIDRARGDMESFAAEQGLERVLVVNLASTEPAYDASAWPQSWPEFNAQLSEPGPSPPSALYAIAAIEAGFAYINFTPSVGSEPAAIDQLALKRGVAHAGRDGKTGETLLKSVLAPMFAHRHLDVMSWVGHNIFGNLDGRVLDDPVNKAAKVQSKDRLLSEILEQSPQTLVSIEYIESLGDWKTAWDHVHFRGFLGTPMTLQFTWQGCDSILAAPLVLDLVRLVERSQRRGESGLLTHLASFFKSPLGVTEHGFVRQFQMLEQWAKEACSSPERV